MSEGSNASDGQPSAEKERTKRWVRRAGRAVFIGSGFILFVTMMVGVVQGIQADRAWNPYTGEPHREGRCMERAQKLMLDAGELDRLTPGWIGRYRRWQSGCKENHPELLELLRETHARLRSLEDESGSGTRGGKNQ